MFMFKTVFNNPELVKQLVKEFEKRREEWDKRNLNRFGTSSFPQLMHLVRPIYWWADQGVDNSTSGQTQPGMHRKKCRLFNEYAEIKNYPDGYTCCSCRLGF